MFAVGGVYVCCGWCVCLLWVGIHDTLDSRWVGSLNLCHSSPLGIQLITQQHIHTKHNEGFSTCAVPELVVKTLYGPLSSQALMLLQTTLIMYVAKYSHLF